MAATINRLQARKAIEDLLAKVRNIETLVRTDAKTGDIIYTLEQSFPEAVELTKGIAPIFQRDTDLKTVYAVWKFERNQITYKRDEPGRQDIRLPSFFLHSNEGDCKSFSLFALAILANLGFNVGFRYAMYDESRGLSHVYGVAKKNGVFYICDGVYHTFNAQKPFIQSKTNYMNTYVLGDVNEPTSVEERGKRINAAMQKVMLDFINTPEFKALPANIQLERIAKQKADIQKRVALAQESESLNGAEIGKLTKEQRKAKRKAFFERMKKGFAALGRGLLFITLGAGRGAFMALIAMNLNGMATKFAWLESNGHFDEMLKLWRNLGGIDRLLVDAVKTGAKKKPLFLSKKAHNKFNALGISGVMYDAEGLGILPLLALAAAAAPVFAALIPAAIKIFAKLGMHKDATVMATGGQTVVDDITPVVNEQLTSQGAPPDDMAPLPVPMNGIGDLFSDITDSLNDIVGPATKALGGLLHKNLSATPAGKALLQQSQPKISDLQYANQYLKQNNQPALVASKPSAMEKYLPWAAGAGIFVTLIAVLTNRK